MTKVDAIEFVLKDNGGVATWNIIYNQIENYYPEAKKSIEWKAGVRGVLYREIKNERKFKILSPGIISLTDYNNINQVLIEDRKFATEKEIQTLIRVGQDKFRKKLLSILKKCPLTSINDSRILNASHIKPWSVCNDFERLDIYNGFIFSPTIDKLFDCGLITFENNKKIIFSSTLSVKNLALIGLENKIYNQLPLNHRLDYLEYHRKFIFME